MIIRSKLTNEILNQRANEVFVLQQDDYIYDIIVENGIVKVEMEEVDKKGKTIIFDYEPDMSERPQALDYLLGLRNDFND